MNNSLIHQGEKTSPLAATLKGLNNKTNHEHLLPNPLSNPLQHKKPGQSTYQKEPPTLVQIQLGYPKNNNCHRYPINGIEDHLHSVTQLQPSVALASLVKDIKLGSATLMKHEGLFPNFNGGQHGYGAFPYFIKEQARRIE